MSALPGDELHELSERQDPRLLRALDVVAPGGALREGRPFAGLGLCGYDTIAKAWLMNWYDNFSTTTMPLTGTSSDGGRTITYTGHMDYCPQTGGPLSTRAVWSTESNERMVFTMFNTPKGGSEQKAMELVYTRRTTTATK